MISSLVEDVGNDPTAFSMSQKRSAIWANLQFEPMEGLEPPMFVFRITSAVLSPLSHISILLLW